MMACTRWSTVEMERRGGRVGGEVSEALLEVGKEPWRA